MQKAIKENRKTGKAKQSENKDEKLRVKGPN